MSVQKEPITEESIKARRMDYATLISNRDELIKFTKELVQKEEQYKNRN